MHLQAFLCTTSIARCTFLPSQQAASTSSSLILRSTHPICCRASAEDTPQAKPISDALDLRQSFSLYLPKPDLRSEEAAATAQALFDDLADRPEYYLNVTGVLLGIALSTVVLSATMVALDSIPFIPDALRMIGLAYLFWFLNKFLFSATERKRLALEIDEFVAGVRDARSTRMEDLEA